MALSHKEAVVRKAADIEEIIDKMKHSKIAILTDYRGENKGMTVKQITDLRRRLRDVKGEYKIYKNTLCSKAMKEVGADSMLAYLKEPTAIAFGFEDSASTSKALIEYLKEHKDSTLPKIKAAYMDGEVYSEAQVKVLATLPSKPEMLAQFLRTLNAPIQGFVNVTAGVPRALVTVLTRIKEEKEKQGN